MPYRKLSVAYMHLGLVLLISENDPPIRLTPDRPAGYLYQQNNIDKF